LKQAWSVFVIPRARKDMDALATDRFGLVNEAILGLEKEPRGRQTVKLTGEGGYRLRVGEYRVLYRIDDSSKRVFVYRVKHRREAYR